MRKHHRGKHCVTILNLSGQELEKQNIQPKLIMLKQLMGLRKLIWNKVSNDKKNNWITSGNDPIMSLAWNVYKYLKDNFFGEIDDDSI